MGRKRVANKDTKAIADRRIIRLLAIARDERSTGDKALAARHVELALRIAKRCNVRMEWSLTCKGCRMPMIPGMNCRVRSTGGRMSFTCLDCGMIKRRPYLKEKSK
jgi:ribonuclease P protein subunit RPR2